MTGSTVFASSAKSALSGCGRAHSHDRVGLVQFEFDHDRSLHSGWHHHRAARNRPAGGTRSSPEGLSVTGRERVWDRTRVQDAVRIQRGLDPAGSASRAPGPIVGQPRPSRPAVFAGDRSAQCDRQIHDVAEGCLGPPGHLRIGGVETISGWVLPSPACAITEIIGWWRRSSRCPPPVRQTRPAARRRPRGAAIPWPRRPGWRIAGRHERLASSDRMSKKTSVAPHSANTAAMNSASSTPGAPLSSEWRPSSPRVAVQAHPELVLDGVDRHRVHELRASRAGSSR